MKDVSFEDLTFRQTVQPTKKVSDHVSACAQMEDRDWKYQKKSTEGKQTMEVSEEEH